MADEERQPLLPSSSSSARPPFDSAAAEAERQRERQRRMVLQASLFSLIAFFLVWLLTFSGWSSWGWGPRPSPSDLPKDPLERAKALLELHPILDTHIDLPVVARYRFANQVQDIDLNSTSFPQQVNIPFLRQGKVGAFFWSAFVPCADYLKEDEGDDFTKATWRVRDTLEQIDVSKLLIEKYSETFQLATSVNGIRGALQNRKIASLIGIEGAHSLGNSIALLRQYYDLGVRYVTLTHTCNNAFAGSCGIQGRPIRTYGLTKLGRKLVAEMNRIGMIVDISHTSSETARDVLKHSRAPPIFSHSNARGLWNVSRNVPDDILEVIGAGHTRAGDALVMGTFAPQFVSEAEDGSGERATLAKVADHIDYLASKIGKHRVGFGSDFDGIRRTPVGLEDVTTYPKLVAELIRRGWTDDEVAGLANANFLRVFDKVERVSRELKGELPATSLYSLRPDLPYHRRQL